ncbi:MAG: hypothetical protein M1485_01400, partial [Chloroflexi bacterium]|nr:hypothetical protein [Chloroflexota bacterium]
LYLGNHTIGVDDADLINAVARASKNDMSAMYVGWKWQRRGGWRHGRHFNLVYIYGVFKVLRWLDQCKQGNNDRQNDQADG